MCFNKLYYKKKKHAVSKNLKINTFATVNYVQENFKTIERLYNIEFNRDWNILNPTGNQSLLLAGLDFFSVKTDTSKWLLNGKYQFEK